MKFYPYNDAYIRRYPVIVIVVFLCVWVFNSYKMGKFRKNKYSAPDNALGSNRYGTYVVIAILLITGVAVRLFLTR